MTNTDGTPENDDVAFVDQPEGKRTGDAWREVVDDVREGAGGDVADDVAADPDEVAGADDAETGDEVAADAASGAATTSAPGTVSATAKPDETGHAKDRDDARPGSTGPTTMREDLGTLAEEGRRLYEAVETRFVVPLVRSYPEVARHLGAAGREIAAAVRTAVRGQEQVWRDRTGPDAQQEKITVERVDSEKDSPESGTTEN